LKLNKLSLKWKLFFAIFLFAILIICIVVVFQITLLEPLYRSRKINRTIELTTHIREIVDNQNIENFSQNDSNIVADIQKISAEEETAIYIFKDPSVLDKNASNELDDTFKGILLYKSYPGGYFNKLDYESIEEIWEKANIENLDTFYAILGISPNPNFPKMEIFDATLPKKQLMKKISYQRVSLMCCTFVDLNDETKCLLILDNNLIPLDSAVDTLKLQLTYITIIVIVLAIIIASLLSRYISKPIVKLNSSAKQMANGQYDVVFEGNGYLEINELNKNLNNTVKELQKTENLRRELMANVSHDLKTPLTMIQGYAEMMKDIPEENNQKNLEIIINEVERLNRLVNDMLNLSKLSSKTMELHLENYSITDNLVDIVERILKLNEGKNINIELKYDENISVFADMGKIEQVIYNFIYNAIHYSTDRIHIEIVQQTTQNKVKISVKDNGIGISENDLKVIWDRYYRVDKTHKRSNYGSGLGLAIAKEILEYHHFQYGVESVVNEGSTFWFEMPINEKK
jgi:hypothetical protein